MLAAALARSAPGVTVHAAGSLASGEVVPGVSDIDLVAVVPDGDEQRRVRARWSQLERRVPGVARGVSVAVYRRAELREQVTCLTDGLGETAPAPLEDSLLRPGRPRDAVYRRLHPGLYGTGVSWRRLAGARSDAQVAITEPGYRRQAAWLELQWWWRFAFLAAARPDLHYVPHLAVKLAAEPARIWLWIEHGERADGRLDALRRARAHLPEEAAPIGEALALHAQLGGTPDVPLRDLLALGLRFAARIAARFEADARGRRVSRDAARALRSRRAAVRRLAGAGDAARR